MSIHLLSAKCKNKNSLVVLSTSKEFFSFNNLLHPQPTPPTRNLPGPSQYKRSVFQIALVHNIIIIILCVKEPKHDQYTLWVMKCFQKRRVYTTIIILYCNCVKRERQSYSIALQKVLNAAHCTELVRMNMLGAYEATLVICPYLLEIASPLPSRRFLSRWWILKAICSQLRTRAEIHTCVSAY